MKNERVSKLEAIAREGFLAAGKYNPKSGWQDKVVADIIRREYAGEFNENLEPQILLQPRLAWRFAAASLAAAVLICLTLYLALPDTSVNTNDYQLSEVSFDNYDNYIEVVAQL